MSGHTRQREMEADEVLKMWDGVCVIEDGVLRIKEKPYRRLISGIKGKAWLLLSVMSVSSLSYAAYLHYADAETVFYDSMSGPVHAPEIAMIGICGGIYVLTAVYGDYIWANLPFTSYSRENTILLDHIREISADNGAGNGSEEPTLAIKYEKDGEELKRVMKFSYESDMRKVEKRLSQ